uniref:uncharacterized protein LOC100182602 isoform X2 n=1 Tax=Ciona intestinalis TaxID=7719 RepID=UPI000EF5291E|nr:uncharacterized protein LOC100182602 isoform X2 [Ciona intestinalis]|eukprot:XP_026689433.1 uncharacterized protein LOC100182602 isoform X2 [Ciona intestinalis]
MSLRTRINGFTAWINLRLVPYGSELANVLVDLTKGSHVQQLLHSMTGKTMKKLQSFEGLTQNQKVTRMEWFVEELKKSDVISDDVKIDSRMVCMKSADHVFDLLWRLVAHDIWFTWERMEFLQQDDDKLISEIAYRWTPDPPPKKKKRRVTRTSDSMMSGFGSSSQVVEDPSPDPDAEAYEKFPGSDKMKSTKPHRPRGGWYSYPGPDECILDMINSQLQRVSEGHKFNVYSLDDLVDSRALCGLVNSFMSGTFTTEVMLNDRWTINLAMRTISKMLHASNPMGSEDLSEADPKSICSYMCFFFMSSYKLRQSMAVLRRLKELTLLVQEVDSEISKFPPKLDSMQHLKLKKQLETNLDELQKEQETLQETYDIEYINDWLAHIKEVQVETRKTIALKMNERFDLVSVPRTLTINELCMSVAINLQLTQGAGFYRGYERETCTPDRRIVLRRKSDQKFLDDFTGVEGSRNIRDILGINKDEVAIVEPAMFPKYEFYFESKSRNKTLRTGATFLYQVFPGNTNQWQRLFFKAVRDGDTDVVKKMVIFFKDSHPDFILSKEIKSGNTALHAAARFGHFEIAKYLLENGCNVNARNTSGWTPLFYAGEGLHRRVAQLLIEWGCNVKIQNFRCQNAFDLIRHEEMKESLSDIGQLWAMAVPSVTVGRLELLKRIVKDHVLGIREMADIGARCVRGSTLLHTAVHFCQTDVIKNLLKARVDVNLKDYQGASPLHRAKDVGTIELLLDSNADVNATDDEGNTALHVRAYGEDGKPSCIDGLNMLISRGSNIIHRNLRKLIPIHCAAMQGRSDAIKEMLDSSNDQIKSEIENEEGEEPPSLPYLAITGNHMECARWLVGLGFLFKPGEANQVMHKILIQELEVDNRSAASAFLLENGGSVNLQYEGRNTSVHLATKMSGPPDVLGVLLEFGASFDLPNDEGESPLFDTMRHNNFQAASILIEKGADVRKKNMHGITALDLIHDFDEWISSTLFTDDIIARFKAYKLKHARDLIRAITKKLNEETKRTRNLMKQNFYQEQIFTKFQQTKSLPVTSQSRKSVGGSPVPRFTTKTFPSIQTHATHDSWHPQVRERRLALPPLSLPQPTNRNQTPRITG